MRDSTVRRSAAILIVVGCFVGLLTARVGYAAAPDVRIVTPAGITIDGSAGDWDTKSADFLADMYLAANPSKDVLSKVYGRYDCGTKTFYMYVQTVPNWVILPSDNDNYVKLGGTQKLVDGGDSGRTQPPAFAYTGTNGWEVAFQLAPGSYTGDGGLNVHAEVTPVDRADTSAVAGRRMDVVFTCPTPTPTPTTAPTPTAAPTEPPSASPSVAPSTPPESPSEPASESPSLPSELPSGESPSLASELPSSESPSLPSELPSDSEIPSGSEPASVEPESPSEFPSEPASELPSSESPSLPSELPSGSEPPSVEPESPSAGASEPASEPPSGAEPSGSVAPEEPSPPPLIVSKVNNHGTTSIDDDRLVGGAVFEIRLDDGDGVYEPDAEDGAPVATLDATKGYATYQPPQSGDYWVKEVSPPSGLATAKVELVAYDATDMRNCAVVNGHKKCQVDEDGSGGFVIAVVSDAPVGHPLPPQTDTVTPQAPSDSDLWQVFLALVGIVATAVFLVRPARLGHADR